MTSFDYDKHDMTPPVENYILDFTDNAYKTYKIQFNTIESAKKFYCDSYAPGVNNYRKWENVIIDCNEDDLQLLKNDMSHYNIKHIEDVTINGDLW